MNPSLTASRSIISPSRDSPCLSCLCPTGEESPKDCLCGAVFHIFHSKMKNFPTKAPVLQTRESVQRLPFKLKGSLSSIFGPTEAAFQPERLPVRDLGKFGAVGNHFPSRSGEENVKVRGAGEAEADCPCRSAFFHGP